MENSLNSLSLNILKKRILETMLYFDVFSYPMKREEIYQTINIEGATTNEIDKEIDALVNEKVLYEIDGFLMASNHPEWVAKRRDRNLRADRYLRKAYRMGRFIGSFPFVRAVMISGSLSKHWMAKGGDVDFFIITKNKRLWVARTLLVLYKKIFLLNSHKYFCVNYFVDTEHLEIEEKNRFTATEIATLLPVVNENLYNQFLGANQWIRTIYPNFPPRETHKVTPPSQAFLKRLLEKMLSSKLGEKLDNFFMRKTLAYWNNKFKTMKPAEFKVALKSKSYVSKHHPNAFQDKVLKAHTEKMSTFEKAYHSRMPIGG